MVEKQPVRKEGQGEGQGQRREPMPLGEGSTGGTGDVSKEALLREQQLSTERQKEGHGWHGLEPGESSGTTPLPKTEPTEPTGGRSETGKVTPGAHKAELMGEQGSGGSSSGSSGGSSSEGGTRGERDEEKQGGVRSQRGERRGT